MVFSPCLLIPPVFHPSQALPHPTFFLPDAPSSPFVTNATPPSHFCRCCFSAHSFIVHRRRVLSASPFHSPVAPLSPFFTTFQFLSFFGGFFVLASAVLYVFRNNGLPKSFLFPCGTSCVFPCLFFFPDFGFFAVPLGYAPETALHWRSFL